MVIPNAQPVADALVRLDRATRVELTSRLAEWRDHYVAEQPALAELFQAVAVLASEIESAQAAYLRDLETEIIPVSVEVESPGE